MNIIELLIKASGAKEAGGSLTELKSGLDMVSGALNKLKDAGVAAFEFAEAGAKAAQTRKSYDDLGISIGSLRDAVGGTVSDMTLMSGTLTLTAGASKTMQKAYTDAVPGLLEMAKAASKLNPSLGDTAFMYESLTTAAKRQSIMIADNLGITIKQDAAYQNYAKSVNKSVDALSAEEKQLAFLNELLASGNVLIDQAGGNVASLTDNYDKMRANLENATNGLKEQAGAVGGVVDVMGTLTGRYAEWYEAANATGKSVFGLNMVLESARVAITGTNSTIEEYQAQLEVQATAQERARLTAEAYAKTYGEVVTPQAYNAMDAMDQYNMAIQMQEESARRAAHEQIVLAEAQREATVAAQEAKSAFYDAAAGLGEMSLASFAAQQIDTLKQSIDGVTFTQEDFNQSQREILETFGLLSEAELAGMQRADQLTAMRIKGGLNEGEYAQALLETKNSVDILTQAESDAADKASELAEKHLTAAQKAEILGNKVSTAETVLYGMSGTLRAVGSSAIVAGGDIDTLQGKMDKLQDKTIRITVKQDGEIPSLGSGPESKGKVGAYAEGGAVGQAQMAWVGERGPELVRLPAGAYVHTAAESERMAAGSVQVHAPVTVYAQIAGEQDVQRLADEISEIIGRRVQSYA